MPAPLLAEREPALGAGLTQERLAERKWKVFKTCPLQDVFLQGLSGNTIKRRPGGLKQQDELVKCFNIN